MRPARTTNLSRDGAPGILPCLTAPSGLDLGQAIILDQFRLVVFQIVLDHLDPSQTGGNALLILKKPVMSQGFPNLHYFDVPFFGLPKLALRERGGWG